MIKIITLSLSAMIFLSVFELIRREKLTFKYAVGWLFVSLTGIVVTIFDSLLFRVAHFFGFQLTSNFVFFTLLTVFVFLSLLMTIFLCQQNSHNDKIAQKIALLEYEMKKNQKGD